MGRKILVPALILIFCHAPVQAESLKFFFLDVGEGDAIYIETPDTQRILIDTGNIISGYKVVQFLKKRGIKKLDILIITHPHPDHAGGVFHILQEIKANALYDNGQELDNSSDYDIYRRYSSIYRNGNYRALKAGDSIPMGKVAINILWPYRFTSDWNENTLVLKIIYGETSFILMGDANTGIEKSLLKNSTGLKANLLKTGHHGAKDASSEEFIKAVSPEYAVISADKKDNAKGGPDPDVTERLKNNGVKIFFTYRDGDIAFESDGKKIKRGRLQRQY
ncbi:MAG: MBL fold metallo-hydrolase [Nitrospirae bacterium]|nr:MBL fold metallo-hydrolase [Nitrospirota bacterium]